LNEFDHETSEEMPHFEPVLRPKTEEAQEPSMGQKWKSASKRWAKESSLAYFSNPAARRDFKVQFRGGKSGWLIAIYLFILSALTLFEYQQAASPFNPIDNMQRQLHELYQVIMIALGVGVALVAPALSATAVVIERQRRSLDLVFCAPVRPRTYLIGKLLASFRFVWILLALSLPFTGICIMLGGATWLDVIGSFFMMSVLGLIYTSIGLLFSSRVEKPLTAVFYTYTTVVASIIGSVTVASMSTNGDPFNSLQNALATLFNPLTLTQGVEGFTPIFGIPIPNLALAAVISLGIIRLCLGAAGSVLAPQSALERSNLRLSAAGALAIATGIATYSILPVVGFTPGLILNWILLPLAVFVPFLSCYGYDGEQRTLPNGLFKLGEIFKGTPAGGLPQILLTVLLCGGAAAVGSIMAGAGLGLGFATYGLYAVGLWTFGWACGRVASSFLGGVRASQMLQIVIFGVALAVPTSIVGYIAAQNADRAGGAFGSAILNTINPLYPFVNAGSPMHALGWGVVFLMTSIGGAAWSESNRRRRLIKRAKRVVPSDAVGA